VEILLNSVKNIASVNVDSFDIIELSNKPTENNEYDIRNVLSVTEIFDAEREASQVYRIYGKIEYMSLLNNLKTSYSIFADFFTPQLTGSTKTLLNSFDFYLVKPAVSGYTNIIGNTTIYYTGLTGTTSFVEGTTSFIRNFQVIATPADFELYPVGFSNNVYGEQAYAFSFSKDFDVSPYLDNFGIPLTQLFLYAQYKPSTLPYPVEILSGVTWSPTTGLPVPFSFATKVLNIGDTVQSFFGVNISDLLGYSKPEFYETQLAPQTFKILTPYADGRLVWKYNPFIPFQLRYFGNDLNRGNVSGTSYELVSSIPYYATPIDNRGNRVWRYILAQGFTDPISNLGVDYPFVNKCRYLFSNVILDIIPDLRDPQTYNAFKDAAYGINATKITTTPIGDINDIGKPCK
jgi:hypothetical protein